MADGGNTLGNKMPFLTWANKSWTNSLQRGIIGNGNALIPSGFQPFDVQSGKDGMAASNNGLLQDANDGGCLGQANHTNIQQGDQGTDNYRDSMSQDKIIVSCMSWSRHSPSLGCFEYGPLSMFFARCVDLVPVCVWQSLLVMSSGSECVVGTVVM